MRSQSLMSTRGQVGASKRTTLDWRAFPNKPTIDRILKKLESYIKKQPAIKNERPRPPTPYHFTLQVLRDVYALLQKHIKLEGKKDKRGNPKKYAQAREAALRAVAYFSWEDSSRVFLARRVYPTYFDFLSYSQVPVGWGALGLMADEFRKARTQYSGFTEVKDVWNLPTLLPYLREANRLDYESVLVIPLIDKSADEDHQMVGAFAFYLRDSKVLPRTFPALPGRFKYFASVLAEAIKTHQNDIREVKDEDRCHWEAKTKHRLNYHAELQIQLHASSKPIGFLDKATEQIIETVIGDDIYAIPLGTCGSGLRKIVFSGRKGFSTRHLENRVLSAVGTVFRDCRLKKFVSYRFDLRSSPQL